MSVTLTMQGPSSLEQRRRTGRLDSGRLGWPPVAEERRCGLAATAGRAPRYPWLDRRRDVASWPRARGNLVVMATPATADGDEEARGGGHGALYGAYGSVRGCEQ